MKVRKPFLFRAIFSVGVIYFFSACDHLFAMGSTAGKALFQSIIDHGIAEHALIDEDTARQEAQALITAELEHYDVAVRRWDHPHIAKEVRSHIVETGFTLAVENNLFWLAQLYYRNGAHRGSDPYSHTTCSLTYPLDMVAKSGTAAQLQFLLELGARPDPCWCMKECFLNPIAHCIRNESEAEALKMIPLLAKRVGANYAGERKHDDSALHCAASRGSISLIKLLIKLGANPNNADTWNRSTPLDHLVLNLRYCKTELAAESLKASCKLLLQYGGRCNKEKLEDCVSVDFMKECKQARADFLRRQKIYAQIASRADYGQVVRREQYYQDFYVGQLDKVFRSLKLFPLAPSSLSASPAVPAIALCDGWGCRLSARHFPKPCTEAWERTKEMTGVSKGPESAKAAGQTQIGRVEIPLPLLAIIADYSGNLASQEEFAIMDNYYTREPKKTCAIQ